MDRSQQLLVLKHNLQLLDDYQDEYLLSLLEQGEEFVNLEGVSDDGSSAYTATVIDYAAYKYRSRAVSASGGVDSESAMPRFLRLQLNNLKLHQKMNQT